MRLRAVMSGLTPATLEITQLELLAREKLKLYDELNVAGLSEEACVALISGAVVTVQPDDPGLHSKRKKRLEEAAIDALEQEMEEHEKPAVEPDEEDPFGLDEEDEEEKR